jgi:hypothetical protein
MPVQISSGRGRGRGLAVRRALPAACAALTLAASAGAARAVEFFGAAAIMTDRACPSTVTSCVLSTGGFTGGRLTPPQFYGGWQDQGEVTTALPGLASGSAAASFGAATDYLPTVKVGSWSGPLTRTGVSAVAFQAFTYDGPYAIDLAIDGLLHFSGSGDVAGTPPGDEFAGDGTLNVELSLRRLSTVAAVFGPTSTGQDIVSAVGVDFPDCGAPGVLAVTGYNSAGVSSGEHTATLGLSSACGGGAIVINPGDSFVVVASLQAISNRGGFLDATHTFTVQYDEPHTLIHGTDTPVDPGFLSGAVSHSVALPEPSAWALMVLGVGGVGAALRRRRTAPAA